MPSKLLCHGFLATGRTCVLALVAVFPLAATAQPRLTLITNQVTQPVDIASLRDGQTMLVVQQGGKILRLVREQLDTQEPYLDISDRVLAGGERGLLGVAVHPQYLATGHIFVNYTRKPDGATVISRFTRDAKNPVRADPESEKVLLTVEQPYSNHNGGALRFGADGFLYIGMGDGGSGNDPQNFAQNMHSLLGKLLRIDVDRGDPYGIPIDNPFAPNPQAGRPEIFAAGLRNPWRFSVDRENGDIYIGDVGQGAVEEISYIGAVTTLQFPRTLINFGWRTFEGTRCTHLNGAAACAETGKFTPPIMEYGRSEGASVTGGIRYTGSRVPELAFGHHYIFGDFVSGKIWQATRSQSGTWTRKELFSTGRNISAFGEDDAGEIFILDYGGGIYKLTSDTLLPPSLVKTAVEYFNVHLQHYFMTADEAEQRSVETGGAGPGWMRTGQSFKVLGDISTLLPGPGGVLAPVCRFYGTPGQGPNSHFYTADEEECAAVKRDPGWTFEGNVFFVAKKNADHSCRSGYVPVYRSYNNRFAQNDSNHRYTIYPAIQAGMVRRGWVDEGVVFCALEP